MNNMSTQSMVDHLNANINQLKIDYQNMISLKRQFQININDQIQKLRDFPASNDEERTALKASITKIYKAISSVDNKYNQAETLFLSQIVLAAGDLNSVILNLNNNKIALSVYKEGIQRVNNAKQMISCVIQTLSQSGLCGKVIAFLAIMSIGFSNFWDRKSQNQ